VRNVVRPGDEKPIKNKEDDMLGYLFAFALFGVLIILIIGSGLYISLYLYNGGAVGDRRFRLRRFRRVKAVTVETPSEETVVEEGGEAQNYIDNIRPSVDSTARFARIAVLVFIGCVLVLILLIASFANAGVH
jgi:hypothetical protein